MLRRMFDMLDLKNIIVLCVCLHTGLKKRHVTMCVSHVGAQSIHFTTCCLTLCIETYSGREKCLSEVVPSQAFSNVTFQKASVFQPGNPREPRGMRHARNGYAFISKSEAYVLEAHLGNYVWQLLRLKQTDLTNNDDDDDDDDDDADNDKQ